MFANLCTFTVNRNSVLDIFFQIGDNSDLQDVVRYLELEHYFSTKTPVPSKVVYNK